MLSMTFRGRARTRRSWRAAALRPGALAIILLTLALGSLPASAAQPSFASWLQDLRTEAAAKGISSGTLDRALAGVEPIPRVIELDHRQPEFTLTFAEYIERVVPEKRVEKGRELYAAHRDLLNRIGRIYGVPPRFVLALWGIESDYGRITGDFPVVSALATLAYDGRRSSYFRGELIDALRIVDRGYIDLPTMRGSWAGAMGQNQFMPSSYLRYAVDYYGTGHRDIWHNVADVLASTANYLAQVGWRRGEGWGIAVRLPRNLDPRLVDLNTRKPLDAWSTLGVRRADGTPLPSSAAPAALVTPGGPDGPAYAVFGNYRAIMRWNKSTFFATAAGLLADRIGDR